MAAPVIESTTEATAVNSTDLTFSYPTGLSANDLILFLCMDERANTYNWQSWTGYTLISHANNGQDIQGAVYYKIADSDDANSSNWPKTITRLQAENAAGWCHRISGVNTSNPINQTPSWDGVAGSGSTLDILGVTTDVDDCLVFALFGCDGTGGVPTTGSGTGWGTNPDDDISATGLGIEYYTKTQASAGATGTLAITMSGSDGRIGIQVAVEPAAGGGNEPLVLYTSPGLSVTQ